MICIKHFPIDEGTKKKKTPTKWGLLQVIPVELKKKNNPLYRNIKCSYSYLLVPYCLIDVVYMFAFANIYTTSITHKMLHLQFQNTLVMNRLKKNQTTYQRCIFHNSFNNFWLKYRGSSKFCKINH